MNPETRSDNYDRLPKDHELISRYKPKFFARGGEHLVYLVEDHPNLVIKVSTYKIKESVLIAAERGLESHDKTLEEEAKTKYVDEINQKNEEVRQLRHFFGNEHTLKERRYLMKVPVSPELLQEVFANDYFSRSLPDSAKEIDEVWTHVVVQDFTEIIQDPAAISATYGHFIEDGSVDPQKYSELTHALFSSNLTEFNMEDFLEIQDRSEAKSLSKLLNIAKSDNQLKDKLGYFVKAAIKYTEETGQILAMAGKDNVVFCKQNGVWTFVLVDVLPNSPEPIFQKTQEVGEKIKNHIALTQEDRENLKRGINFVRVINGIALSLSLPERLKLPEIFSNVNLLDILNPE